MLWIIDHHNSLPTILVSSGNAARILGVSVASISTIFASPALMRIDKRVLFKLACNVVCNKFVSNDCWPEEDGSGFDGGIIKDEDVDEIVSIDDDKIGMH
ncbi:9036_t:CDS:2, partial [Paraglomus occultum]